MDLGGRKIAELSTLPFSSQFCALFYLRNGKARSHSSAISRSQSLSPPADCATTGKLGHTPGNHHAIVKGLIATQHLLFLPGLRHGPWLCGSHIVSVMVPRSLTLDPRSGQGSLSQHELLCKWLWGQLAINKHFSSLVFSAALKNFPPGLLLHSCNRIANCQLRNILCCISRF